MLTFLATSPRTAAGAYSRAAWAALEAADAVLAPVRDAHVDALVASGIRVEVGRPDVDDLVARSLAHDLVWLLAAGDDRSFAEAVTDGLDRVGERAPRTLEAPPEPSGARLVDAVAVMDRLRTSCPWDREQTHASLAKYLVEETYETLEAIDAGDPEALCEELGDVLLQVLFHARVAAEGSPAFDIDDVALGFVEKMVRRHPHVFADVHAADAGAVEASWEGIKAREKSHRTHVLDGVPPMPSLERAEKVGSRLDKAGRLDVARRLAGERGTRDQEVGRHLLAVVLDARADGIEPAGALRATLDELRGRL